MKGRILPFIGLLGLLLMAVGGVSYAVIGEMTTPVAVLIWSGLLLALFFFYVYFPEIKDVISGRSARYGFNMVVMVGIFASILTMTALMSVKYKAQWDLTKSGRYTLSDQTLKILKGLERDVEAVAFYRSDERTRQEMEDLLEIYASRSSRFSYWFVDPDKKPGTADKYGVTSYRTTLMMSGANREAIGVESEERITNAILKVTKDETKKIYFLKGHGENSILNDRKEGYKAISESLGKERFEVEELLIIEAGGVPEDAAVLVVSGPKKELLPDELTAITAYVQGGGSALFMLDPRTVPGVAGFLAGYGFHIGDDIIIDTLSQVFGANYLVPVVTTYEKDHPITEEFDLMTFFPLARSVSVQVTPEAGIYTLMSSGDSSWGETDRESLEEGKAEYTEGTDRPGPVPLAAVITVEALKEGDAENEGKRMKYGKIVVFGDSDFVSNTHINLAGNRDLFLNTVSWLAEEADLIAIRKKTTGMTPVILTSTQGRLILWFGVVIPPTLVAVVGFAVFMRRRLGKTS
ncbi:MAG: Gldg family protein [Thermodesulfobacteriota bacterium]